MSAEEFEKLIEENYDGLFFFVEGYLTKDEKTTDEFLKENSIEYVEDNDKIYHDSYGYESSTLERIYLHQPSGKYFMIYGTRQSYEGTEWDGIKEVNKTEKTITVWT